MCTLIFCSCNKNHYNNIDFKTKSITLYKLVKEDGIFKFDKCISFTDAKSVDKIVKDCRSFDFKGLTSREIANFSLDYYLVFDDSKVVIQFGDLDTDMGRLGKDFNPELNLGRYREENIATYNISNSYYVHIPLNTFKILKDYIE